MKGIGDAMLETCGELGVVEFSFSSHTSPERHNIKIWPDGRSVCSCMFGVAKGRCQHLKWMREGRVMFRAPEQFDLVAGIVAIFQKRCEKEFNDICEVVVNYLQQNGEVSADIVHRQFILFDADPRIVGAAFKHLSGQKAVKFLHYQKSERPVNHHRPIGVFGRGENWPNWSGSAKTSGEESEEVVQ